MNGTFVPAIGHLIIHRTYLSVNEPMLFSACNEFGDLYFVSYADLTENGESWIMSRVSSHRLRRFESGEIDIRDMFLQAENGTVVCVEYNDEDGAIPILSYFKSTDEGLRQFMAAEGQKNPTPRPSQPANQSEEQLDPLQYRFIDFEQAKNLTVGSLIVEDSRSHGNLRNVHFNNPSFLA